MDGKHASLFGLQSVIPRSLENCLDSPAKAGLCLFYKLFTENWSQVGRKQRVK